MPNSTISESELTIKVIQVDTTVPFKEVIARLDGEVNKAGSNNIIHALRTAATQEEFTAVVRRTVKNDFLYFNEIPHHSMLRFDAKVPRPAILVYTIGNPLIAQVILRHNPIAAYSIPPRLLVFEKPNGAGAIVHYHLPSSIMGLPNGKNPLELEKELQSLDAKVGRMVQRITTGHGFTATL